MGNVMLMKSRDILTLDELKSHMNNKENPHGVTVDQINGLNNIPIVAASSTDGIAYTGTDSTIKSQKRGMSVLIVPNRYSNSANPTFDLNGYGAKAIRRKLSSGTGTTVLSPVGTLLYTNRPTMLTYDGTYWIAMDNAKPVANDLYGLVPIELGGTFADNAKQALDNLGAMPKAVPMTTAEYEAMESHDAGTMYMLTDDTSNTLKTATFSASGWSATAPYTQAVTVNGIDADSTPVPMLVDNSSTLDASKLLKKEYGYITYFDSGAGKITATCKYQKPTVAITVGFKGV